MEFDRAVLQDNFTYMLWGRLADGEPGGVLLTLIMAVSAGVLALLLGVLMAALAWRFGGLTRKILFVWASFIRGIPLIFVIFWLYFLLPVVFGGSIPGPLTVILALAWFTSAAVMHSTLAGLEALPRGQTEAGIASGMSNGNVLLFVLLPQAWPNLLPSYLGLLISLVKDTSLAFIVNVPELTTVAGQVNNRVQIYPAEIFLFVGLMYYLLCATLAALAGKALQRRRRLRA
ncbi:glutamate transport membrane-spanning protein [Rahnella aquatilis CIP 78.65 = ATCC 33071]|uniref:Amine acid ABC transporter, permease protein, 3-TM region, His/Glu/Gln/Arg/opine family n=1 Tax=Rahnella aquatilis (strain ATCC 33071 / DSM 4594 / JCM 1683 / NBRC 105701 / NCIMB 13365 / CIP 78.65) TaxID=745277 RepID=H2IYR6_RAHAC|nr:ABC transporter permease subunit [Rahnella aquatilis]AEX52077.1 amine acid ABC transporter, permease protein, 3-TM region, His/Glu/Gln/Arg/opine family [Rahnella aquatilis CIP 78.65 = ATCC 33071]KFD13907.1 glutamate transport membrane-spanning protein [Rahnella aquatilis CIP 78.65 = ATCC 33071]